MEIKIRTGFEKVSHNIEFNPQGLAKGAALVKAGHVQNVEEVRKKNQLIVISGRVIRQTSVTSTPYLVQLFISSNRNIIDTSCNCVSGLSKKCKHVAALIEFINYVEIASKTDCEQVWGKPTLSQFAKVKYSKGKYFDEMFPAKHRLKHTSVPPTLEELHSPSPLRTMLLAKAKDAVHFSMESFLKSVERNIDQLVENNKCKDCLDLMFARLRSQPIYPNLSEVQISYDVEQFYAETIKLTDDQICDICCKTLSQSGCNEWFSQRRCRLSASKNIHEIKIRKTRTIESIVSAKLFEKRITVAATRYGLENESIARKLYEKTYGVTVVQMGLMVHPKQHWLCASVDGVICMDGDIKKLIEIKCPITCKKQSVVDFEKKVCMVKYLEWTKTNEIKLKKQDKYYTQVQTQMYVTGATECDLFVYSPIKNGSCNVNVKRDNDFIERVIILAEQFYFTHYLPVLQKHMNSNQRVTNNKNDRQFTGIDVTNISEY